MSTLNMAIELERLRDHLASQVTMRRREADFDMDDGPEADVLAPFAQLQASLQWLDTIVTQSWRAADAVALRSQSRHRSFARVAIVAGTSAISLAVFQLSTKLTFDRLTNIALALEVIAVASAFAAVIVGVVAKYNRRWLGQRHLAERLRMLKFRALEQLLCMDRTAWQQWVEQQRYALIGAHDVGAVEEWSKGGEVELETTGAPRRHLESGFISALTIFYRYKRLTFQANYFEHRRRSYAGQTRRRRSRPLGLFLGSVLCVLIHFTCEALAGNLRYRYASAAVGLDSMAVWFLALAAVIPVIGLGMRAWVAAFELPRSASLYAAKHRALLHADEHLAADTGSIAATQNNVAQTERFLEDEHREWLRLLLDTEWFL